MSHYRTHLSTELGAPSAGASVILAGWLQRVRELGGILFLVLRDRGGIVQLVLNPQDVGVDLRDLRVEASVRVEGVVRLRPEGMRNPEMETGAIEVMVESVEILGRAAPLPFQLDDVSRTGEALRLTNRFLELREDALHARILLRAEIISHIRHAMTQRGFHEFQTPILTVSSPEGARDFLVPSRLYPGTFYALPQAPQQFKQLLMASGFERYFQIAPCFRDEAGRMDRSPGEFYQLDMEMAFVTQEEVFALVEGLMIELFEKFSDWEVPQPFPQLAYAEAMSRYGTDKPDLRFGMELCDVTRAFEATSLGFIEAGLERGERIQALVLPGGASRSRKYFGDLEKMLRGHGAPGIMTAWATEDGAWKGSVGKKLGDGERAALEALEDSSPGCAYLLVMGKPKKAQTWAGRLRTHLGEELGLAESEVFRFCWIVDFPMYEEDEETGEVVFSHNPFSMPQGGLEALQTKDPLEVLAYQYDLVCNGLELSSGAIRNHQPELMVEAFRLAGYPAEAVEEKFGALYRAFQYGPPPHGGIAPGIDRIVMLLSGADNIRDVVAFPMTASAKDLLMGAPATVTQAQLEELGIEVREEE